MSVQGVGALTPITNGQGANFTLQFTNQVDTDYFIAVDAAANAEGSFDLAMTAVGSTNAGHFEFARTAYSFTEEDGTEQIYDPTHDQFHRPDGGQLDHGSWFWQLGGWNSRVELREQITFLQTEQ